jgi:3'-5' exoribonuclease
MGKVIEEKKLFLAAFFHDVGKMWDYEPLDAGYKQWKGTFHKRHIHHITRSALVWQQCAGNVFDSNFVDEVLHAILSHHGSREFGSPVAPNTKLAWMVCFCDGLSARLDDAGRWDRIDTK